MSRRIFQVTTLAALALAAASLWVGFGISPGADASLAKGASAEWTPDLKSPNMSSGSIPPGKPSPQTLARLLSSTPRNPPDPFSLQHPPPAEQPPQPIQVTSPETLILKGI